MICTSCKNAEAVVFVKTIIGNKVSQQALCADCAGQTHQAAEATDPLESLLSGMPAFLKLLRPTPRARTLRCAGCGLTYAELRQAGKLGCSVCYDTFEAHLRGLIPRIHGGATGHRGGV
ncbi:MAG: hypothetical protein HY924_12000 [Elusimicrobia bacterium]|nr:hypothetical protein [Elusimicrobiota bacterium]